MEQQLQGTEREAVLVEDAARDPDDGDERPGGGALPRSARTNGPTRSSWCTRVGSGSPRWRARTRSIRTAGSTTSGTCCRARPAPVTPPGPGGSVERARLSEGSLLALRTGRGAWHAEGVGADEVEEGHGDTEFRSVLFWVNLARKDKHVEPSAQVLRPDADPGAARGRRDRPGAGGRGLAGAARDAGADPRRRVADGWR